MCSCASIVLVFLGSVCSAVAMGGGRPLSRFDELLSIAVLTALWWMLLIAGLVTGVVEWFIGKVLLDVRFRSVDLAGHLAVCDWNIFVDGMLRRTARKSVLYAGELVVPEPLYCSSVTSAILRQPVAILSAKFCAHGASSCS